MGYKSEMRRSFKKSIKLMAVIKSMLGAEKLLDHHEALYKLCIKDPYLKIIMKKYMCTKEDVKQLSVKLWSLTLMPNFDGNYVPASAFAFTQPLEFVLKNKIVLLQGTDEQAKGISNKLWYYFENDAALS